MFAEFSLFKLFPAILCLLFATAAKAQLSPNELAGDWRVEEVATAANNPYAENPKLDSLKAGFVDAHFVFKKDGNFRLLFPSAIPAYLKELFSFGKISWKYDAATGHAEIGTKEDHYSDMGMYVRRQDSATYFYLEESPFIFRMKKQ
jgi:hypothetical protein